jgi:hypothetical protein
MENSKVISEEQKRKIIRLLLEETTNMTSKEIKKHHIDRLMSLSYKELIRPLVIKDRSEKGLHMTVIARKYRVTDGCVKWICNNYM